ncbi:MAG: hypothetical protein MHM6MM_003069 [Cercozoa sp. M6MM]
MHQRLQELRQKRDSTGADAAVDVSDEETGTSDNLDADAWYDRRFRRCSRRSSNPVDQRKLKALLKPARTLQQTHTQAVSKRAEQMQLLCYRLAEGDISDVEAHLSAQVQRKQVMAVTRQAVIDIKAMTQQTREVSETIDSENADDNAVLLTMTHNALNSAIREFSLARGDFQTAVLPRNSTRFEQVLKEKMERKIHAVFGDRDSAESDNEAAQQMFDDLDTLMRTRDAPQRLQRLLQISPQTAAAAIAAERRHLAASDIEDNMEQLASMFQELLRLVLEQGEFLDNVTDNVQRTHKRLHKGETNVVQAATSLRRARRCRLFCFCSVLIVALALLAVYFLMRQQSSSSTTSSGGSS